MHARFHVLTAVTLLILAVACDGNSPTAPGPAASQNSGSFADSPIPPPGTDPRYRVTGSVTDSRENPVADAEVWIYDGDSPIDQRYGTGVTDEFGGFSVTSQERIPRAVRAMKSGYVRTDVKFGPSAGSSEVIVSIKLPRIERYVLMLPASLKIGQSVMIESRVDLDDGTSTVGRLFERLSSSNETVIDVQSSGWVIGRSQGTATVHATYYGAPAMITLRVDP
jgi:hypothetical protein